MSQKFSTEHVVECKCVFGAGVKQKEKHCGDPIQYVCVRERENKRWGGGAYITRDHPTQVCCIGHLMHGKRRPVISIIVECDEHPSHKLNRRLNAYLNN